MALDKDVLGTDLYNRANAYNEVYIAPGDLETARLAYWKNIAEGIIEHFKNNGVLHVPGTGLVAGSTAVTGTSNTGTIS